MMPNIGVVPKLDHDFKEGNINQSNINGDTPYDILIKRVAADIGRLEDLTNPTKTVKQKKRNFGEI